jgi:hypothetical protein
MKFSQNQSEQKIKWDAVLFDCILLAGFILLAVVSINYNPRARSIPMALGIIGFVMMFLQFLVDAFPRLKRALRFVGESGILATQERKQKPEVAGADQSQSITRGTTQEKENQKDAREWFKVLRLVAWIAAFIFLLGMTHYLIAVGLFVALVTRIEAKESWTRAVVLAACVNAGFFVLFNLILKAQI